MIMMLLILMLTTLTCLLLFSGKKTKYPAPAGEEQPAAPWHPFPESLPEMDALPEGKEHYRVVHRTRRIPRKTYLFGFLTGKYYGAAGAASGDLYNNTPFYDFHIYEAEVQLEASDTCSCMTAGKSGCRGLHKEAEGRFEGLDEAFFPREKLPAQLPVLIKQEGQEYAVTIYEPQLAGVRLLSRMHCTDGTEVSGTIQAYITGILLDFTTGVYTEALCFKDRSAAHMAPLPDIPPFPVIKVPVRSAYPDEA